MVIIMIMIIKEIISKTEWESFLLQCQEKTFLQSWNWGAFQQSLKNPVWRLGIYQDDRLISVALAIRHVARRGSFLLVPHGPVVMENETLFKVLGFRLRPLHTHPESSWKLDISPSEEHLLDHMRKTTRYLIRQAQKDEKLTVVQSFNIADVETFNAMHLEVVKHQKFVPFSLEYFKKEFLAFSGDNQIALFLAKYDGKVIAASYVIFL